VRLNYPLANDCAEDRKRLCPDAQPVREAAAESERPSTMACCSRSSWKGTGSSDALRVAAFMCLRILLMKLLILPCAQRQRSTHASVLITAALFVCCSCCTALPRLDPTACRLKATEWMSRSHQCICMRNRTVTPAPSLTG
jgi:hypothetical protein